MPQESSRRSRGMSTEDETGVVEFEADDALASAARQASEA
jgi:hypothetical protein